MNFTREISLTDITNLNISSSINVEYVKSDNQYAIAMSDTQKGLDLIDLTQNGDNLIISQNADEVVVKRSFFGTTTIITNTPSHKSKVIIGMPYLPNTKISGSGSLNGSDLSQSSVKLSVSGSGNIKLQGDIFELKTTVQGSGNINIADLKCNTLIANVKGSGNIKCFVSELIEANITGSGSINISGKPTQRNISKTGSGHIQFN